jgi:hypothetical protein
LRKSTSVCGQANDNGDADTNTNSNVDVNCDCDDDASVSRSRTGSILLTSSAQALIGDLALKAVDKLKHFTVVQQTQSRHKSKDHHVDDDAALECTHLITDSESRTLKVLFAIARGAWIIQSSWILESIAQGTLRTSIFIFVIILLLYTTFIYDFY